MQPSGWRAILLTRGVRGFVDGLVSVLLAGNAVNYAIAGQGVPGLTVGEWKQTQAPKMDRDVVDLMENRKIPVYVIVEDLAARGIEDNELVEVTPESIRLRKKELVPHLRKRAKAEVA